MGNQFGFLTILVSPLDSAKDSFVVRILSKLEKKISFLFEKDFSGFHHIKHQENKFPLVHK
jgi:hypothetical protein